MNLRARMSKTKASISTTFRNKLLWTFGILCIYFLLLHLRLFGIPRYTSYGHLILRSDSLSVFRAITASKYLSLAEFGIIPIVLSIVIFQLLIGLRIIKVDFTNKEDRKLYAIGTKVIAIFLTIVFALVASFTNYYGEDIALPGKFLVLAQLLSAGFLIILLDELLQRGYGLGSGTSLFILVTVCYHIFEGMFSLNQEFASGFSWYRGCILAFFQGIRRGDLLTPFYNTHSPYVLLDFILLLVVLAIVIYFVEIKLEIPAQSKTENAPNRYPIMSLYTFYVPVIFSSALFTLIAFLYSFTSISTPQVWPDYPPVTSPQGFLGIFFPPYGPEKIVQQPGLVVGYIIMMTLFCGFFSRIWYNTASMDYLSVAKQFLSKDFLIPGFREHPKTVQKYLNQYIPTAIWIGGFIIGFLAGIVDFLGPLGTGTGVLVAICIIREYYDIIAKELFGKKIKNS
jgi:protein transport protein SEC61 subunit alpha